MRLCRALALVFFAPLALAAQTTAAPATATPSHSLTAWQILQRAMPVAEADGRAVENYAWQERDINRRLDKHGLATKVWLDETYDVSQVGGVEYRRLIARHGQPLSPADQAKQDRKLAALIAKQNRQSPAQQAKRQRRRAKEERERQELIAQVPLAFRFTLLGERSTPLCDCYVIQGEPLSSFHPSDHNLKLLQHFAGTLWIDVHSFGLARMDLIVLKPVTFGWFLVRLSKGGHVDFEQAPIGGHWFPSQMSGTLAARIALFKHVDVGLDQQYGDYRRFQVSTRVLAVKPATAPRP